MAIVPDEGRLRALLDATVALSAEPSLDSLLQRLVETSASLTGARYAALEVIDEAGVGLERFTTTGLDEGTDAAISDLPHGRGTLSVPIVLRGVAFGNLYLTQKEDGSDFTEEDDEIVRMLASQGAVAIDNARLYESATLWSRQLESLHEIIRTLVQETDLDRMLELVCRRLRELIGARLTMILLPAGPNELRIAAADGEGDSAAGLVGTRIDRHGSKAGNVLDRRQSARVDNVIDDPEIEQQEARRMGVRSCLLVPLVARDRGMGVISLVDKIGRDTRFSEPDRRIAELFAARAAVAVDLSERVARDTVRRVIDAQEQERRRLARELHDETGQALTSILLGLKTIRAATDTEGAERAERALRELVVSALQDVRSLAVELRPSSLDDFGLSPALERLTTMLNKRGGLQIALESNLAEKRLPPEAETVLYRFVQEALNNVSRHAEADHASVVISARADGVSAVVEDDGSGFDATDIREDALGLVGMRERLALLNGTLSIESKPGEGATLIAFVPS